MLFNSLEFTLFFPLVLAGFFGLPHRLRWAWLLAASYLFYMSWEPAYGLLIAFSTLVDFVAARRMGAASRQTERRAWLGVSLLTNLGLLFSFKYYNFLNSSFRELVGMAGVDWPMPESSLLLPVGISFYTFQTLSYTIDVYRGEQKPETHLGLFALYVSYFPQLVAGPVERAGRLLPQLKDEVVWDGARVASGLRLTLWGLFKKVVVADRLGAVVDPVFDDPTGFGGFAYVMAALLFSMQLYCDFSGYSDMAIGVARTMGVDLMKNFDQPHLASSLGEFWSRWHISMTRWFRDYVYIPLGGNRHGEARRMLNVFLVMLLSGLWHGATWPMVIWGGLHGLFMVAEHLTAGLRGSLVRVSGLARAPRLVQGMGVARTFFLWTALLFVFRCDTLADLSYMLAHLGDGWTRVGNPLALQLFLTRIGMDPLIFLWCLLLLPLVEVGEWIGRDEGAWARFEARGPAFRALVDYAGLFCVIAMGRFDAVPFVYFQF